MELLLRIVRVSRDPNAWMDRASIQKIAAVLPPASLKCLTIDDHMATKTNIRALTGGQHVEELNVVCWIRCLETNRRSIMLTTL
jgi:hypothetical protein